MKINRLSLAGLLLVSLACNFFTGVFDAPTPTPLIPAYIPPGCEAVLLATVPVATLLAQPTPELQANPEIPEDVQLRVFERATEIIEEVYVYPDFNGKDWPA